MIGSQWSGGFQLMDWGFWLFGYKGCCGLGNMGVFLGLASSGNWIFFVWVSRFGWRFNWVWLVFVSAVAHWQLIEWFAYQKTSMFVAMALSWELQQGWLRWSVASSSSLFHFLEKSWSVALAACCGIVCYDLGLLWIVSWKRVAVWEGFDGGSLRWVWLRVCCESKVGQGCGAASSPH